MRRRAFITLLGGAAAWPLPLCAQQAGKLPTIGYLGSGTRATQGQWTAAFVQRLRDLGWIEGRTIAIEYRWAEGRNERYAAIAAEFVQRKVDVIVAIGTAVVAAKEATIGHTDCFPGGVGPGWHRPRRLARAAGRQRHRPVGPVHRSCWQACRTLARSCPRSAPVGDHGHVNDPGAVLDMRAVQATAGTSGLDVVTLEIRRAEDIAPAFEALKGRADALYVCGDALVSTNRIGINTLAVGARLPTMHGFREYAAAGGLMSYGPNFPDLFRRAGDYVDKILRGARPSDIPVEQPTKFDLVINLITAKALGLEVPTTLLARADEVIE